MPGLGGQVVSEQHDEHGVATRAERAGQLLMVGLPGPVLDAASARMLRRLRPGGICLYRRNITSEPQLRTLLGDVRGLFGTGPPPLLAVDEEGGAVSRFDFGGLSLPGAMALGATGSVDLAERAGLALAQRLTWLGIDINFAPVLEVASNPASRTIGTRAFSDDPELVFAIGAAFVRGQRRGGILSVAKHFPGHGADQIDSHSVAPILASTSWDQLDSEAQAFKRVLEDGNLAGVMMGHALAPALIGNSDPVTVSTAVITDYLKTKLRFAGVVITDALSMGAMAHALPAPLAAQKAIAAGADMVLVPSGNPESVHQQLVAALARGELAAARVDAALERIAALRAERQPSAGVDSEADLSEEVARAAITVLQNRGGVLPLHPTRRIGVITTSGAFHASAQSLHPWNTVLLPSGESSSAVRGKWGERVVAAAVEGVRDADVVVVALINEEELPVFHAVAALGKPIVLVSLGRPWLLELGREAEGLVAAYSYHPASAAAAVAALTGSLPPRGRLPVALPHFARNAGLASWSGPAELASARPTLGGE